MGTNASILLVNKQPGMTSFSALHDIKRTVDPKVGHAGTLDKFAEGLLVVLTGSMTKLNVLFSTLDKTYRATIQFGSETDTLDPEGRIVAEAPIPDSASILAAIPHFIGDLLQEPPVYSALHVGGKRASDLARAGKDVSMEKRPITVYSFDPVSYENGVFVADIHVSKGTYIRSLARDLALFVGSRGYLRALRRTSIGPFSISEAILTKDREALLDSCQRTDSLISRLETVSLVEVPEDELFRMANGSFPSSYTVKRQSQQEMFGALYSKDGILRSVADMQAKRLLAQIHPFSREASV